MRILLATDGSEGAIDAARWVGEHFTEQDQITVVLVSRPTAETAVSVIGYGITEETWEEVEKANRRVALAQLDQTIKILEDAGLRAESVHLEGLPVDELVRYARTHEVDLIVMGNRGRSLLAGLVLGSVSLGVLTHAPCPVLVVPPRHHPPE
ncbi:Usp domain-containing protein [Candidatus Hydrogenisulfobacillus filiaventi]|uniref:Usp domain-containing protein n=1 Tax=Candidatus Hydrogenisulfobacillus filiaventi TaxID=2707344 RepID=A0A6F8ZH57_9FIRM|nr:universal stress protein [Bacillota bacterium]CAB1128785.1 Usp domain-containing protein [Candidatus Hydrogenisulfobacillus filiaventi]